MKKEKRKTEEERKEEQNSGGPSRSQVRAREPGRRDAHTPDRGRIVGPGGGLPILAGRTGGPRGPWEGREYADHDGGVLGA